MYRLLVTCASGTITLPCRADEACVLGRANAQLANAGLSDKVGRDAVSSVSRRAEFVVALLYPASPPDFYGS